MDTKLFFEVVELQKTEVDPTEDFIEFIPIHKIPNKYRKVEEEIKRDTVNAWVELTDISPNVLSVTDEEEKALSRLETEILEGVDICV